MKLDGYPIVMTGMSGVGKSAIGEKLADHVNYHFVDVDRLLEKHEKKPLQQILDDMGDENFIVLERVLFRQVFSPWAVFSPGGSLVHNRPLMKQTRKESAVVFLDDDLEAIKSRMGDPFQRGIVGLKEKTFDQIYQERRLLYMEDAHIIMDCRNKVIDTIVGELARKLKAL